MGRVWQTLVQTIDLLIIFCQINLKIVVLRCEKLKKLNEYEKIAYILSVDLDA